MSVSQALRHQKIRLTAAKGPLGSRVAQLLQITPVGHQAGLDTKQQVRRKLLCMHPSDQTPRLLRILSRLAHAGQTWHLCLLQGTDEPLPTRFLVQHIPILKIAAIPEFRVVLRGDRQVLARIDSPKEAFLEVRAKTIVVPDSRNEESGRSLGERKRHRGKRNHRDIVHAEPSTRKRHVVADMQVEILELKPPGRRLTCLRIAVRKPALFHPIMLL